MMGIKHICFFTLPQFRVILSIIMILFSLLLLHVLLTPCQALPGQVFRTTLNNLDDEHQVTFALSDNLHCTVTISPPCYYTI